MAGVLLTDAEIDHTAGLLLLRESSAPLPVYSTAAVRDALSRGYPLLRCSSTTAASPGTRSPTASRALAGTGLQVETFATGGDAPLYLGDAPGPARSG